MTTSDDAQRTRRLEDFFRGHHTVVMVMTMVDGVHTSRPVTCVEVADGRLAFLVSSEPDWVQAIAAGDARVHATVADEGSNTYLSLGGRATVTADVAERRRLWNPVAKAWFDGPEDERLRVLRFEVTSGEYWDGPGSGLGKAIGLLRAVVTHDDASMGSQGHVAPR